MFTLPCESVCSFPRSFQVISWSFIPSAGLDWISLLQRQRLGRKGCMADKWDVLGMQQDVDGVAALHVYSWWQSVRPPVQPCPVFAPLLFCTMWGQQYSGSWCYQQVPLKHPVALGRQGEITFAATQGLVPSFHRATGSSYSFTIFKPKGATLLFAVLWR